MRNTRYRFNSPVAEIVSGHAVVQRSRSEVQRVLYRTAPPGQAAMRVGSTTAVPLHLGNGAGREVAVQRAGAEGSGARLVGRAAGDAGQGVSLTFSMSGRDRRTAAMHLPSNNRCSGVPPRFSRVVDARSRGFHSKIAPPRTFNVFSSHHFNRDARKSCSQIF